MKRLVAFGLVAVVLAPAAGCGGPDALARELIHNLNQVADAIDRKEPKADVLRAIDRANATAERINKLKLSREEQEALFQKHDAELKAVAERLKAAQTKWKLEVGEDLPPVVMDDYIKK